MTPLQEMLANLERRRQTLPVAKLAAIVRLCFEEPGRIPEWRERALSYVGEIVRPLAGAELREAARDVFEGEREQPRQEAMSL